VSAAVGAVTFAIIHYQLLRTTEEARSGTTLAMTIVSITIVALNLGEHPGRWRLLPLVLLGLGLAVVEAPALRNWFNLATQTRGGAITIVLTAAAGSLVIAAVDLFLRRQHNHSAAKQVDHDVVVHGVA
jgi:drug/metabolite transporter (DMT)-like permease